MKEIKLRLWDKLNKAMFSVSDIDFEDKSIGVIKIDSQYDFNEIELMQYTGRKDKDNVELYNGDILKYVGNNCPTCGKRDYYERHRLYMISWDDSTLSYECMEIGGDNYMGCNIWGTDMIKVGSRYENPELLEGKESNE